MTKVNKKNSNIIFDILSIILTIVQTVLLFVTFNKIVKIVLLCTIFAVICLLIVLSVKKQYQKIKITIKEIEELRRKKQEISLIEIYGILNIAPQYNEDGTLKDIFQLLGIKPEYDENGNRKLTIYELLGINPRFSKDGKELPTVTRIKNRIYALVKTQQAIPLFYVPRNKKMIDERYLPLPVVEEKKDQNKGAPTSFKQVVVVKTQAKKPAPKENPKKPNYASSVWGKGNKKFEPLNKKPTKKVASVFFDSKKANTSKNISVPKATTDSAKIVSAVQSVIRQEGGHQFNNNGKIVESKPPRPVENKPKIKTDEDGYETDLPMFNARGNDDNFNFSNSLGQTGTNFGKTGNPTINQQVAGNPTISLNQEEQKDSEDFNLQGVPEK